MKKALLVLMLAVASTALAQSLRMKELFVSMPDSLMPTLPQTNRHDMLDFLANGMEARVHNQLTEEAILCSMGDTYALVETSAKSRIELKLLYTAGGAGVVVVIRTVMAPAADSHVAFYNTEWHRLGWVETPRPAVEDFWDEALDSLAQDAATAKRSLSDLCLVEVKAKPDEPIIEMMVDTDVLAEQEKDAAALLVHPVRYLWDGIAFRKKE